MKLTRKDLLRGAAVTAFAGAVPAATGAAAPSGETLKVCVFADLHYFPGELTNDTPEFLEQILARAEAERCDMVIHLGDLVHRVLDPAVKGLIGRYNGFKIPAYHVLGNHDQDGSRWQETVAAFGMPKNYYSFDRGGFRFVCLDTNYYRERDGKFVHYELRNNFRCPKGATRAWIPPDQLEWLADTLRDSPNPCIVLSHQSFERWDSVKNAEAVRRVFTAANAKHPGRVRLVINGHHHVDYLRILDGIPYWDVNSANYMWYDATHNCFPAEYFKSHRDTNHCLAWDKPLSAILTLHGDGRIVIEGSEAGWLFGVTPEKAKLRAADGSRRAILPRMQSASFKLGC